MTDPAFTQEKVAALTEEAMEMATLLRAFQRAMLEGEHGIQGTHMLAAAFLLINSAQECWNAKVLVGDWQGAARAAFETALKIAEHVESENRAMDVLQSSS